MIVPTIKKTRILVTFGGDVVPDTDSGYVFYFPIIAEYGISGMC